MGNYGEVSISILMTIGHGNFVEDIESLEDWYFDIHILKQIADFTDVLGYFMSHFSGQIEPYISNKLLILSWTEKLTSNVSSLFSRITGFKENKRLNTVCKKEHTSMQQATT